MRKFTKLLLTLAMLFGAVGVNAEKVYADLSKLSSVNGANATWDGTTNTITWTGTSYNIISNFDFAAGDYKQYTIIGVTVTNLTNADFVRLQIKANDQEKICFLNGTGTFEKSLTEDFGFTVTDLEHFQWARLLGSNNTDSHTFNSENPASAVISEVYLEGPDVDRCLVYTGEAKTNSWDKQAIYDFPTGTAMVEGETYIVKADIKSTKGGDCALWPIDNDSENKNEWGGSVDVQYCANYNTTTSFVTYTWEFEANHPHDRLQFVFGTLDGKIYFDNVSCVKKGTTDEMVVNGDFSANSTTGWSANWNGPTFELEVITSDPLASQKEALSKVIAKAKLYNGYVYTNESFSNLTSEITTAEAALIDKDATEVSLTTAKTNLQDKIDALALKENYSVLTTDMFKHWTSATEPTAGSSTGCAYDILVSTGMPYGDGSVGYLNYADLTDYEQLIVIANEGTPRVLMNRVVNNGQYSSNEADSKMIEMPKTGEWTDRYYTKNDVVYVYDLALMTQEKGFAHLNSIKGLNGNVTVSGLFLYKTPDPLADYKENLKNKINEGSTYNAFGKTEASFGALSTAINNGNAALVNANATQESLESATTAIDDAIAGLVLADGYTNLVKNMFMTYASVDEPGDGTDLGVDCAYVIHEATGQPYGDAGVTEFKWVDLAGYDKLYIVTMGTVKPRIMINRLEKNGNQAATQADSKMIEINPNGENAPTWSTERYQKITGNVYEIDLNAIREDYGFVRLHAIKGQNYGSPYVTDMLLYKSDADVAVKVSSAGWTSFSSDKNVTVPDGITAYAASYDGTYVDLQPVTEVPAGNAVLIEGTIGTYRLPVVANATTIENNDLFVSDGTVKGESGSIYALSNGKQGIGFYKVGASVTVPAGKAYLVIENDIIATREFVGIGGATAIREVQTEESADNSLYNLAGQRVVKAQKGLFIQNGKKFFVK